MNLKWQEILVYGGGGTLSVMTFLFLVLNLSGMQYTIPGDQVCGTDCFSEIQVNSSYWEVCVEHAGQERGVIYKKVSRGRRLWLNLDLITHAVGTSPTAQVEFLVSTTKSRAEYATGYGYLRAVKDGDCIIQRRTKANNRPSRIIIHGVKEPSETVTLDFSVESALIKDLGFKIQWLGDMIEYEDLVIPVREGVKVRQLTGDMLCTYHIDDGGKNLESRSLNYRGIIRPGEERPGVTGCINLSEVKP